MKNNRSTIIRQLPFVAFIVMSLLATLSSCSEVKNQDAILFPISENGKWGFINAKGEVIIKPQYYDVDEFKGGLCAVQKKKGGLYGFIDCTNKMIIRPKFDDVLLGFDKNGHAIVELHEDLFLIDKSGQRINIDSNLTENPILGDGMEIGSYVNQNLLEIKKTDNVDSTVLHGLYDIKKKKVIIQPEYESIYPLYAFDKEDAEVLFCAEKTSNAFLVLDESGKPLPIVSESQILRWDDVFLVEIDSVHRLVDKEGHMIKDRLVSPNLFSWGVLIPMCRLDDIKQNEDEDDDIPIGFINKKGEFVIEPQYSYTGLFRNGLAYVEKTKGDVCTYGYIDTTGTFVWSKTVSLGNDLPPHSYRKRGY